MSWFEEIFEEVQSVLQHKDTPMERRRTKLDELDDEITKALAVGDYESLEAWQKKKEDYAQERLQRNLENAKQKNYTTLKFRDDARSTDAIVHPSSREKGRWQASLIDSKGAFSHRTYDTQEEAVRDLYSNFGEEYEFVFVEGQMKHV